MMHSLEQAVNDLDAGRVVAFPTETVYGLGADADNAEAVAAIYRLKQRPLNHPVIVHVPLQADLQYWSSRIPLVGYQLIERFWPGPLTLIVPKAAHVLDAVTGGQDTVGLRCPSHPVAQQLLHEFVNIRRHGQGGVAAPSANKFGRLSPTIAQHVIHEFMDTPELTILEGGASQVGIESTILDISAVAHGQAARLLRPGTISKDEIAAVLGYEPHGYDVDAPRVSGSLKAHYAPRTPMRYWQDNPLSPKGVILSYSPLQTPFPVYYMAADPLIYAQQLYAVLHYLDQQGYDYIYVQAVPSSPEWDGVRDRLNRAIATFD